jgi:alpha-N-arabinofuranosidase
VYAELVKNRAFQGSTVRPSVISPWVAIGNASLSLKNLTTPLSSALPTSLNIAASSGVVGVSNPGYWGIDVKVQKYTGSFWVKGTYNASFTASLYNYLSNETLGSVDVPSKATASEWREHTFTLIPGKEANNVNNTLRITFDASVSFSQSIRSQSL